MCILLIYVIYKVLYYLILDCGNDDDDDTNGVLCLYSGGIASCCRAISTTQIHRDLLESYYVQHEIPCLLNAVV